MEVFVGMGDLFDDCNTRGSEELVAEVVSFVVCSASPRRKRWITCWGVDIVETWRREECPWDVRAFMESDLRFVI